MPLAERLSAAVVQAGPDAGADLDLALDRAGFWAWLAALGAPQRLRVLIKPDLTGHAAGSAAATSPALVERLIELLLDRGCGEVSVAAACDGSADWLENREPQVAAELLGYAYATPSGVPYDVIDLADDAELGAFPPGALLADVPLSRVWRDADVRIVFAKNRTCSVEGYSLCLASLIDLLPGRDKLTRFDAHGAAGDAASELIAAAPVHLALIDARESAHGAGGALAPEAIATDTLIAALDPRLADFAGALKMGLDPYVSPLFRRVAERLGPVSNFAIDGDISPYPGWRNAPAALVASAQTRAAHPALERTVRPWLQSVDTALFPFREAIDARVNAALAPLAAQADDNPAVLYGLIGLNHLLATGGQAVFAGRVLADKDAVRRSAAPVNIDLAALRDADFTAVVDEAQAWRALLVGLPAGDDGLRHRRLDGAVVFEVSREIPFPFEAFVRRFDVSRAIQLMNDYVGGRSVALDADADGRPLRQVERNLYLPQPNYLALWGGAVIDVTKLEVLEYGPDRHRMWWKTVKSENGSARYDDGLVEISATAAGTRIVIQGRQDFTLPPIAQALRLDLQPPLQAALTGHAYGVFAQRTFANFEAVVEGRDPRIGRPQDAPAERPVETIARWVDQAQAGRGPLGPLVQRLSRKPGPPAPALDADGFTHVGRELPVAHGG